jgi:rRNA processing protein Krr1/Pno1
MRKEYSKTDRKKSRSRSRSKTLSKERKDSNRDRRERKKTSKWSDAPDTNSKFTNSASDYESKININSVSNQLLAQQMLLSSRAKMNPTLNCLDDNSKLRLKIYIPKSSEINYVGLLIGPKGTYQKRLEQQTGCKILIRGKGTQKEGNPPQPDDHEEKHVLIIGDSEDKLARAQSLIERVLFADEKTRNRIKDEQIKASQEIRSELLMQGGEIPHIEDFMLTPYGPPDKNARIVPVPNDCVGLIIGKNGETIRRLNRESGCKVQIAIRPIPNTDVRNVFIEGPPDKYEIAKKLIEEIVSEQITLKEKNPFFTLNLINTQNLSSDPSVGQSNPFPGPHTPLRIPNKMVGLIIGRNGETVKNIHEKTKCFIFIPKDSRPGEDFRELQLSGPPGSVELCKREIISMIHLALYGRLPYMNSLFYPFLDPVTGLPIIDPNTLSQLDPNTKFTNNKRQEENLQMPMIKGMGQFNQHAQFSIPNQFNQMGMAPMMQFNQMPTYNTQYPPQDMISHHENFATNNEIINQIQPIPEEKLSAEQVKSQDRQIKNKKFSEKPETTTPRKDSPERGSNLHYDLDDYDNPMNYDLYFQSLYQMYPHMNDYFKQGSSQNVDNPQYIICNNGLMDETRGLYDPNFIVSMFNQIMVNSSNNHEGEGSIQNPSEADNSIENLPTISDADYNKYIDHMYNSRRK